MTTATTTENVPNINEITIDIGHIVRNMDMEAGRELGRWDRAGVLELNDGSPDAVASAIFDWSASYEPSNPTAAVVRLTYGEKVQYFQLHPTFGMVPRLNLEDTEDGYKLAEIWPYQDEVGGIWVTPHVLPDGHLVPMCYVEPSLPEGFQMGDEESPEKDRKIVHVPGGFMFMFPTTVEEWNWFCNATGRTDKKPTTQERNGTVVDVTRHPVTNVSFHDASDYAKWAGVGIPTEEEWERAARGNDGRIYPWGNETPNDDLCCSSIVAPRSGTDPVDAHPKGKSPYGIHDMSGNVWEWTSTFF